MIKSQLKTNTVCRQGMLMASANILVIKVKVFSVDSFGKLPANVTQETYTCFLTLLSSSNSPFCLTSVYL